MKIANIQNDLYEAAVTGNWRHIPISERTAKNALISVDHFGWTCLHSAALASLLHCVPSTMLTVETMLNKTKGGVSVIEIFYNKTLAGVDPITRPLTAGKKDSLPAELLAQLEKAAPNLLRFARTSKPTYATTHHEMYQEGMSEMVID